MFTLKFLDSKQIKARKITLAIVFSLIAASFSVFILHSPHKDWQSMFIITCIGMLLMLLVSEMGNQLKPADEELLKEMLQWLTELKDPTLNLQIATAIAQSMVITRKNHQQLKYHYEADIQRQKIEKKRQELADTIEKLSNLSSNTKS